jgi:hypothetical protein
MESAADFQLQKYSPYFIRSCSLPVVQSRHLSRKTIHKASLIEKEVIYSLQCVSDTSDFREEDCCVSLKLHYMPGSECQLIGHVEEAFVLETWGVEPWQLGGDKQESILMFGFLPIMFTSPSCEKDREVYFLSISGTISYKSGKPPAQICQLMPLTFSYP